MHSGLAAACDARAAARQITSHQQSASQAGSRTLPSCLRNRILEAQQKHPWSFFCKSRTLQWRQRAPRLRPCTAVSRESASALKAAASDAAASAADATKIRRPAFYEGLERPIGAFGNEWHPLFALAIFAIGLFNHLTFNSYTLFKAFAIFQIANSAVSIIFNDDGFDKISSVVAPAVLAIWVMQPALDPGDVTLGILGTYLSRELKVVPFWPMALSLFAALSQGSGNEWITVAYCLLNVTGLSKARQTDPEFKQHKANLLAIPVVLVSAFVAWKGILPQWTTSLGLGEVARSTYGLLDRLKREQAEQ